MFPWLAHGHVSPFLELAKNLCNQNFHIYFCSTPINLDSIKQTLNQDSNNPPIELIELHLPSLPSLPPHYHTTKNIPPHSHAHSNARFSIIKPILFRYTRQSKTRFTHLRRVPALGREIGFFAGHPFRRLLDLRFCWIVVLPSLAHTQELRHFSLSRNLPQRI